MAPADVVLLDRAHEEVGSEPSNPWFKFWPAAWLGDERLRMCSFAAQGLLVALMCLMHKARPYGHLLINGRKPTDTELARVIGAPGVSELRRLRDELIKHGVLCLTPDGTPYSRRMVRDASRSANGRASGLKGGNPALLSNPPLTAPLTLLDNHKKRDERGESTPRPPKGARDLPVVDSLFARFWDAYPRKDNRKAALKEWQRIRPVPNEAFTNAAIAAMERQKRHWTDPKFILHARTWLHNARWEDPAPESAPLAAAGVNGRTVPGVDETRKMLDEHQEARLS